MKKKKLTPEQLKGMEDEIMKMAKQRDVDQNYFFVTAFNRYKVQISILNKVKYKTAESLRREIKRILQGGLK